ncbi:hypothetical protein DY000_02030348 [Brassica cretica]|uniref:Uncharacterized protein n=1 Tax=Brassica cretica TaxID=69181 RepID=A0ABQ7E0J2_BRACR|nr:hypothetical protein DY000_02030348 [Brassica cretica]
MLLPHRNVRHQRILLFHHRLLLHQNHIPFPHHHHHHHHHQKRFPFRHQLHHQILHHHLLSRNLLPHLHHLLNQHLLLLHQTMMPMMIQRRRQRISLLRPHLLRPRKRVNQKTSKQARMVNSSKRKAKIEG